ncbi:MAG: hypothetical protein EOO61_11605 [Hymenobacter sp.]|nr:MAG: hypothetical protein EOO61_11605 [Hymenobacter sp.]
MSSHFDRVPTLAKANANGSAIAVSFNIICRHQEAALEAGVLAFFFEKEEVALKSSQAYVEQCGTTDPAGLRGDYRPAVGEVPLSRPVSYQCRPPALLPGWAARCLPQHLLSDQGAARGTSYGCWRSGLISGCSRRPWRRLCSLQHYHFFQCYQSTDTCEKPSEASLTMASAAVQEISQLSNMVTAASKQASLHKAYSPHHVPAVCIQETNSLYLYCFSTSSYY